MPAKPAVPHESAAHMERTAAPAESAEQAERAAASIESAEQTEPAVSRESAVDEKRADKRERAATPERAVETEGAVSSERVATDDESAETIEREPAGANEGAEIAEPAAVAESANPEERAGSAIPPDPAVPLHRLGYPKIYGPEHHLWDAQQANWPDHLPHEAWRELVRVHNTEKQPAVSSADHPAFAEDYVPNYLATPEQPEPEPPALPGAKGRR